MKPKIINRWVILGALGIATALLLITIIAGLGFTTTQTEEINWQLAALTVLPGPTSTPRISPTPTHNPAIGTPTPQPNVIAVGGYVQISGTNGEGLRLRDAPGLNSNHLFLGFDTEVYQVTEGPEDLDGYTWWHLRAPYDETRTGWAASDFLEPVSGEQ